MLLFGYLCLCSQQFLLSDVTTPSSSPLTVVGGDRDVVTISASLVVVVVVVDVVGTVVVMVVVVVFSVVTEGVCLALPSHCHCLSSPSIMMLSITLTCSLTVLMSY